MSNGYKEYASKDWVLENLDERKVSWDELEGKPFYELTHSVTYDGGLEVEEGMTTAPASYYRKVTDEIPNVVRGDEVELQSSTGDVIGKFDLNWGWDGNGWDANVPDVLEASDETTHVVIALKDNVQTTIYGSLTTFTTKGVYFYQDTDIYVSKMSWKEVKEISEDVIPDSIARTANVNSAIEDVVYEAKSYTDEQIESHKHNWDELENKPFGESFALIYNSENEWDRLEVGGYYVIKKPDSYGVRYNPRGATLRFTFADGSSQIVDGTQEYEESPSVYIDGDLSVTIDHNDQSVIESTPNGLSIVKIEEVGELKTLDEKFIPESISRAEHKHTWDELEGKPFELKIEDGAITTSNVIAEQVITTNNVKLTGGINPNGGVKYIVKFDDEYYQDEVVILGTGINAAGYLGNLSLCGQGEDNGLPYAISQGRSGSVAKGYIKDTLTSHTIYAQPGTVSFTKLDEIFIPNTIARTKDIPEVVQSDWENNNANEKSYIKNRTHWVESSSTMYSQISGVPLANAASGLTTSNGRYLEIDKSYTIQVNSDSYDYTAPNVTNETYPDSDVVIGPYLGNLNLIKAGSSTSTEPFFLANKGAGMYFIVDKEALAGASFVSMKLSVNNSLYHTLDEKFLPDSISRADHTHSWNSLEDKPFGEGESIDITWDGDISQIETMVEGYNETIYCHISDLTPSNEQIRNGFFGYWTRQNGEGMLIAFEEAWDCIHSDNDYMITEGFFINMCVIRRDNFEYDGMLFPKAGIYFGWQPMVSIEHGEVNAYVNRLVLSGNVHTLDEKYIPETIARVADVSSKIATALSDYYTQAEVEVFHDEIKDYVDDEVAALVNAAPETLDTIGELAAAFAENKEVVDALDASITNKQDKVSDTLILVDTVTGKQHKLQIQNGQLVSFPIEE